MPKENSSNFFDDFDSDGFGETTEISQKARKKEARNFAKQIIKNLKKR